MSSLTDVVYNQILADILTLELKPGERLHIANLAKKYKTGLSPIREALAKLTSTELVVAISQKGFRVTEMSKEDLYDLYETRTLIESLALKLAIENGDESWEEEVVASFHRLAHFEKNHPIKNWDDYQEWEKRHRDFNFALIKACGLHHLLQIQEKLFHQTVRYRRMWMLSALSKDKKLPFSEKQKQIMDAALKRDKKSAIALLEEHFTKAVKAIENTLE